MNPIDYCISSSETLLGAVAVIKKTLSRCVLVTNASGKIIGVISEGDVLMAILDNLDIHTPVRKIVKPSFIYLNKPDMKKALSLFRKFGITLVPVLDKDFCLKGVITIFDMIRNMEYRGVK